MIDRWTAGGQAAPAPASASKQSCPPPSYEASLANKGLLSPSNAAPLPSPPVSFLSLRSLSSHIIHIANNAPWRTPVTTYVIQLLHLVPSRLARLAAQTNEPGVWMHIMGMLSDPTCLSAQVVYSCGIYCKEARTIDWMPRKFAQAVSCGETLVLGWAGQDEIEK